MNWLKVRLRRWLGIDQDLDRLAGSATAALRKLEAQQQAIINRIEYYEEHVEAMRYAKQRLIRKANGQRIHLLSDQS